MLNDVIVSWRRIMKWSDPKWDFHRCLYAYVHPLSREILYLGKADRCTTQERWTAPDKRDLHRWLRKQGVEGVHFHVGEPRWGKGRRYSPEKLADVESLLIHSVQPPGNIMATASRIVRPGMRVVCRDNWPHPQSEFLDGVGAPSPGLRSFVLNGSAWDFAS